METKPKPDSLAIQNAIIAGNRKRLAEMELAPEELLTYRPSVEDKTRGNDIALLLYLAGTNGPESAAALKALSETYGFTEEDIYILEY